MSHYWLFLFIIFFEELLILDDGLLLPFFFLLFSSLFSYDLSCWHARQVVQSPWLEPAVRDVQLPLYLLPHTMHLIDGEDKFGADSPVVILGEGTCLILTQVVAVKTVLKCE